MSTERKKILEMVKDGTITIEEADELLSVLESDDEDDNDDDKKGQAFSERFKEDLKKTKEELIRAKDRLKSELEKINTDAVKEKIKLGVEKIDKAMSKVDVAILNFGNKLTKKNNENDEGDQNGREN